MHIGPLTPIVSAFLLLASTMQATAPDPGTRAIRPDRESGTSAAVVVPAETALIFTTQVVAPDAPDPDRTPEHCVEEVLDRLDTILRGGGSGLDRAVRLHVVLASPDLLPTLRSSLAERFPDGKGPALNVVVGARPRAGAMIAIDAVALTDMQPDPGRAIRPQTLRRGGGGRIGIAPASPTATPFAVLPAGPRVFISGQAEAADDLATATRKTLESLGDSLDHLGLGKDHVVQLKAFFLPPELAEVVEREVATFFEGATPPPLVLVEWESSLPIEIELVAFAPEPGSDEAIDYLDTPKLAASPVFSRIARVNRGDLVFVSGLTGPEGADGTAQVEAIFADLAAILDEAGTDLDHLAKATYYVSDDDPSNALNALRPNYYDPKRPPAASKAQVPGVGRSGRSISVDMIAVVPED